MDALTRLFGGGFGLDDIVDCRVTRASNTGPGGAVDFGPKPTQLRIVLRDGRALEASSRGPGAEESAIEEVVRTACDARARATLGAIAQGAHVPFGEVEIWPEGLFEKGSVVRWEDILYWSVDDGYLVLTASTGTKKIWLANTPFGDALVLTLEMRLPDRHHGRIEAERQRMAPMPGAAAAHDASASKNRRVMFAIVGAIVGAAAVLFGISIYGDKRSEEQALAKTAARISRAIAAIAQPAASLPACGTKTGGSDQKTLLLAGDRSSVQVFDPGTRAWQAIPVPRLLSDSTEVWVWSQAGADTHVIRWDNATETPSCHTITRGASPGMTPLDVAMSFAQGQTDRLAPTAPPATAPPIVTPPPPPPPPPSASASTKKGTKKKKK